MKKTQVSNEQLIAALIQYGTVREAAKAAGISERAYYERMKTDDFAELYADAKGDILRAAVFHTTRRLQDAVDTVCKIMNDAEVNPATRLQACQTIINNVGKLQDRLQRTDDDTIGEPRSSYSLF